jgi:hypothetical protein
MIRPEPEPDPTRPIETLHSPNPHTFRGLPQNCLAALSPP